MARYIDADKLIKKVFPYDVIDKKSYSINAKTIFEAINNATAEDVVKVVRCKDCIYYQANCCFNRQWDFESSTEMPSVRENDFCSYGERKPQKEG